MTVGEYILKYLRLNATNQKEICHIAGIQPTSFNEMVKEKRELSVKVAFELERRLRGFSAKKVLYMQVDAKLKQLQS